MSDDPRDGDDDMQEMLRRFLQGDAGAIDPDFLAKHAGAVGADPALVARIVEQLQRAMNDAGDGIDWSQARDGAKIQALRTSVPTLPAERSAIEQALHVASLWLDEATAVSAPSTAPRLMSRTEWADGTMPVWIQLAEPVAESIADALTEVIPNQAPEGMEQMLAGASKMVRSIGGTMFSMQLGQVVGQLATEVVSGGDIGMPLLDDAVLVPQNVFAFGEGLEVPRDQVALYLSVRELAHARLFRHAKWLRSHVTTSVTAFARGIRIDVERMQELASEFDPQRPETIREAVTSGAFVPERTEEQQESLANLETMLALIEGWVDTVTADATTRLPSAAAVGEAVRRRRAAGGPAEQAFATLVGLELRPRRLREAAAMWRAVTDAVGVDARDRLWTHPDLVPTAADVDDPQALVARLTSGEPQRDDLDRELDDLLRGDASE